jgi:hypothetical protein
MRGAISSCEIRKDIAMNKDTIKFNYGPEQWAAIIASAKAVRPTTKLTTPERQSLLNAANNYRRDLEYRKNPDYRPPSEAARRWATVAELFHRIHDELAILQKHENAVRTFPSLEGIASIGNRSFDETIGIRDPADHNLILSLLEGWERDARMASSLNNGHLIINHFTFGRAEQNRARNVYYRAVFKVWVDMIGGTLGYSTTRKRGVSGPTPRFIRAVTVPVMGEKAAPKPETIPGILDREKRMRERDTKLAESFGLRREEFHLSSGSDGRGWYEV